MSASLTLNSASPAALLLQRLEGVITTSKGWRARCPNCGGKSPKLSIYEGDNGTLLLNCFKCHDTLAIMVALGLQMGDLFQRRDIKTMTRAEGSEFRWASLIPRWLAALNVLDTEAIVLLIAANKIRNGEPLTEADWSRFHNAVQRISKAWDIFHAR